MGFPTLSGAQTTRGTVTAITPKDVTFTVTSGLTLIFEHYSAAHSHKILIFHVAVVIFTKHELATYCKVNAYIFIFLSSFTRDLLKLSRPYSCDEKKLPLNGVKSSYQST